jgi:hypothetical protein
MNPYMQNVVGVQQREAQRQADIATTGRNAQATTSGAFGGSRQAITDAEAARNLATQKGDIQTQGLNTAYQQAQQAQQTQAFTAQLQKQIDESNAEAATLQARQAELTAAETAAKSAQMQGSYATEATSVAPTAGQTTTKVAPKTKAKTGLKIAPGAGAIAAGTGLNIGV